MIAYVTLEELFAQDRWDGYTIPGARFNVHSQDRFIDFQKVPAPFRAVVKQYIKHKVTGKWCINYCADTVYHVRTFLHYLLDCYGASEQLQYLTPADIDSYILFLKTTPTRLHNAKGARYIWTAIHAITHFLHFLVRIKSPYAPRDSVDTIIWPEHLA